MNRVEAGAPSAAVGGPDRRHPSALAVPAFRRLWSAGIVSDAGEWLMLIALPLVVLRLTGSAPATSLAFLLALAPPVLLAPVIGAVVDRFPRRQVLVAAMLGRAAVLGPLLLVDDRADLPILYAVITAQAAFAALFEPAKNALLPTLVGPERIVSANALVGLNNDLGRIIGGPLGGILLVAVDLRGVTLVTMVVLVVAAGAVRTLPRERPRPAVRAPGSPGRRPSGWRHVLTDQGIRGPILVVVVASIAQGLFVVLFVFFVTDVINGTEADVGLLRGIQAVGAIAAGAVLGTLGGRLDVRRLCLIGAFTFAGLTALTWNLSFLTHAIGPYVVLFAAVGAPAVLMAAGLTSLLQGAADDAHRGVAFAALGLGQAIGQGVGIVLAGTLQGLWGTLPLLQIQAATYVAAAVLAVALLRDRTTVRTRSLDRSLVDRSHPR